MKRQALLIFFLLVFSACENAVDTSSVPESVEKNFLPPVIVKAKPPVVTSCIPYPAKTVKAPDVRKSGSYSYMQNYNTAQGLAVSSIASGYTDKAGNLWFGTLGGGVSRYNGKRFVTFTTAQGLSNNVPLSICEDKDGNMWFGTLGGGISKYDGTRFTNYSSRDGLANDFVWNICQDNEGNMWFATYGGGASCFNGTSFRNYTVKDGLCSDFLWSITKDKNGHLWFGSENGGISCFDGKSFRNYKKEDGLIDNFIRTVYADTKGNIWCGGKHGLSVFDGKDFTNYTTAQGLPNNDIWCIHEDKQNTVWLGSFGGGASRFDPTSPSRFITIGKDQGMLNSNVRCVIGDHAGNLWFGTMGGGIFRYDGHAFQSFSQKEGLPNNYVRGIIEDKNKKLWFATLGGGVSCFDGSSFTNYSVEQGLLNPTVWCGIQDKKGDLWFGTEGGGVFIMDHDKKKFRRITTLEGLSHDNVWCLLEDKKGNIWMGTNGGGVCCYDGKQILNYTTDHGLAKNVVRCLAEDSKGNVWMATEGGGVSCFDGSTFTNYTTEQGLGKNSLRSIMEDRKGNIWFGTVGGGVSVIRNGSKTISETFNTSNGLSDDVVYDLVEDKDGNMIIGTNQGFSVLRSGLPKPGVQPLFEVYNNKSGYPVKDINSNAMLCDSRNIIWAGTGDDVTSLVRFDLNGLNKEKRAPELIIESIKLNNELIPWNDLSGETKSVSKGTRPNITEEVILFGAALQPEQRKNLVSKFSGVKFSGLEKYNSLPKDLVLPYKNNNIGFDFTAIEPARPYLIKYQFMLEGYDRDWTPWGSKTEASFGNMSEGNYTFKIRAKSVEGTESEIKSFSFRVLPPWYRTWWAYTLYVVSAFATLWFFIKWREKALVREKLILEAKIESRTSELKKQKNIAEKQTLLVEAKQKEILDSIQYARRIQQALLASDTLLNSNLPEHFVFFKPKDVVSGDFYWATPTEDGFIYITADCTGHGVPGAFMSLLNISKLSQIINENKITRPDLIFNHVRTEIIKALNPEGSNEESKDGMDAVLCKLDLKTMKLDFAAANNSFYIIRNGEKISCKADKMPVGKGHDDSVPFTHTSVQLQKGDVIYTFTDGFADQFGGPKGKKFKYKQLERLLISIYNEPMNIQKHKIQEAFTTWKKDVEQVDDVCVMGVRV
jgi:ligand-binding sensor domain-containing protein/serine phosphatase RsbU (regulator of sigma subunit)